MSFQALTLPVNIGHKAPHLDFMMQEDVDMSTHLICIVGKASLYSGGRGEEDSSKVKGGHSHHVFVVWQETLKLEGCCF